MKIEIQDMLSGALELDGDDGPDVSTHEKAAETIDRIDEAIGRVSSEHSKLGSYQNRLEHTMAKLTNNAENLQAVECRTRDVDMAREIMEYTKRSLLAQVASAMLVQANQQSQSVLSCSNKG